MYARRSLLLLYRPIQLPSLFRSPSLPLTFLLAYSRFPPYCYISKLKSSRLKVRQRQQQQQQRKQQQLQQKVVVVVGLFACTICS